MADLSEATILDLSGEVIELLTEIELDPGLTELTLMHCRLRQIDSLLPLTRLAQHLLVGDLLTTHAPLHWLVTTSA